MSDMFLHLLNPLKYPIDTNNITDYSLIADQYKQACINKLKSLNTNSKLNEETPTAKHTAKPNIKKKRKRVIPALAVKQKKIKIAFRSTEYLNLKKELQTEFNKNKNKRLWPVIPIS